MNQATIRESQLIISFLIIATTTSIVSWVFSPFMLKTWIALFGAPTYPNELVRYNYLQFLFYYIIMYIIYRIVILKFIATKMLTYKNSEFSDHQSWMSLALGKEHVQMNAEMSINCKNDPLSIISLFLALAVFLLGPLLPLAAIPAIICARISLKRIKVLDKLKGDSYAIAAMIIGYAAIFCYLIVIIIGLKIFANLPIHDLVVTLSH